MFVGAIVIGDLRLLGWGPVGQSRASIARSAQRILLWAGLAVLVTGIPQFTTNALTYQRSWLFVFKMCLLAAALVFTATRAPARGGRRRGTPALVGPEGRRRRVARALDGRDDQRPADHLLRLIAVRRQFSGGAGSCSSIGSPTGSPLNIHASVQNPAALRTIFTPLLPVLCQHQP